LLENIVKLLVFDAELVKLGLARQLGQDSEHLSLNLLETAVSLVGLPESQKAVSLRFDSKTRSH
jgi:hypothetical protein